MGFRGVGGIVGKLGSAFTREAERIEQDEDLVGELEHDAEELPERAEDFRDSCLGFAAEMRDRLADGRTLTEGQRCVVENMIAGCGRWRR